ncbi:hypothetical protein [Bacillus cereus]|uniref:hypothetical protein n=1 Tax=Bacillus cereus TaxID=1396 RepID=UPI000BF7314A|nr:hypothetical protein [Bacillus cereus]PFD02741.1 hypothetical protein CN295_31675 [Bacillus cereus]
MKHIKNYIINKIFNLNEDIKRNLVRTVLIILPIICIGYYRTYSLMNEAVFKGYNASILDGVSMILGDYITAFFIVPLFLFYLTGILSINQNYIYILKHKSRNLIWNIQVKKIILHSFLFTSVLVGIELIISYSFFGSYNYWQTNEGILYKLAINNSLDDIWIDNLSIYSNLNVILILILFYSVTLILIGIFYSVINILIADKYLVSYIIVLILIGADVYLDSFSLFFNRGIISLEDWFYMKKMFWDFICLIGMCTLMYFMGQYFNNKRDFLSGDIG